MINATLGEPVAAQIIDNFQTERTRIRSLPISYRRQVLKELRDQILDECATCRELPR